MNVKRKVGHPLEGLDDHRPHRQIRDEETVHDVDVNLLDPGLLDGANVLPQTRKVRRQDRWGDPGLHEVQV